MDTPKHILDEVYKNKKATPEERAKEFSIASETLLKNPEIIKKIGQEIVTDRDTTTDNSEQQEMEKAFRNDICRAYLYAVRRTEHNTQSNQTTKDSDANIIYIYNSFKKAHHGIDIFASTLADVKKNVIKEPQFNQIIEKRNDTITIQQCSIALDIMKSAHQVLVSLMRKHNVHNENGQWIYPLKGK
jgi:CHAT domain-containing protein